MDRARLGAQLRRLRELRGLTLREVEARAGVSFQYVSALEHGAPNANVTLTTLVGIATALDCEVSVDVRPTESSVEASVTDAIRRLSAAELAVLLRIATALPTVDPTLAEAHTRAMEAMAGKPTPGR